MQVIVITSITDCAGDFGDELIHFISTGNSILENNNKTDKQDEKNRYD
jgi:hypothetical protein